jgi:hypothetical protein
MMIKSDEIFTFCYSKKYIVRLVESIFHPGTFYWLWQTVEGARNEALDKGEE